MATEAAMAQQFVSFKKLDQMAYFDAKADKVEKLFLDGSPVDIFRHIGASFAQIQICFCFHVFYGWGTGQNIC
eukprot:114096-Karenia_brevis.AAC.1